MKINLRQSRRGHAAVEAALILPLLVILTFLLIEWGWMFWKAGQIENAVRGGVRTAILPSATQAGTQKIIDDLMKQANIAGYTTEYLLHNPSTNGDSTLNWSTVQAGDQIKVRITVPYNKVSVLGISSLNNIPLIGTVPLGPTTLGSSATMGKEGT